MFATSLSGKNTKACECSVLHRTSGMPSSGCVRVCGRVRSRSNQSDSFFWSLFRDRTLSSGTTLSLLAGLPGLDKLLCCSHVRQKTSLTTRGSCKRCERLSSGAGWNQAWLKRAQNMQSHPCHRRSKNVIKQPCLYKP